MTPTFYCEWCDGTGIVEGVGRCRCCEGNGDHQDGRTMCPTELPLKPAEAAAPESAMALRCEAKSLDGLTCGRERGHKGSHNALWWGVDDKNLPKIKEKP